MIRASIEGVDTMKGILIANIVVLVAAAITITGLCIRVFKTDKSLFERKD